MVRVPQHTDKDYRMKTTDNTKESARERILSCAAKIFAQKSFDGARVDEIAKEANVPKSLIYYHFKSKEEIFEVLTEQFLDAYASILRNYRDESNRKDTADLRKRMRQVYYQFGMEHEALIRTILIESVKKENYNTTLYRMMQTLVDSTEALTDQQKSHLVNEFFFNIIPCIAYICFKDSWTEFFQMDASSFDETFLTTYSNTHINYHNNLPVNE